MIGNNLAVEETVIFLPVLQRSAEAWKWSVRSSMKPPKPSSAPVAAVDAELRRRGTAASGHRRISLLASHFHRRPRRRHRASSGRSPRTVRRSIASKQTLGDVLCRCVLPLGRQKCLTVRIPQSTHLRYTYVYICIPLKKLYGNRDLSIRPDLDTSDCRATSSSIHHWIPGLSIGSASSRSEGERVGSPFVIESRLLRTLYRHTYVDNVVRFGSANNIASVSFYIHSTSAHRH